MSRQTQSPKTRKGKDRAQASSSLRDEFESLLRSAEERWVQSLRSSDLIPEMVARFIAERVDPTLSEITLDLQRLRESQDSQSWKQDVDRLDQDIQALRDYVNGSNLSIRKDISLLKEGKGNESSPPVAQGEDDEHSNRVERNGSKGHSNDRSSSRRKTKSSRRAHRRMEDTDSDSSSDSNSSSDSSSESSDSGFESEVEEVRVADKQCRKVMRLKTYRLARRSRRRNKCMNPTKMLNKIKHLYDGDRYDGSDP